MAYIVERVYTNDIAFLQAGIAETGDKLANECIRLGRRDRVGRIRRIDVDLANVQYDSKPPSEYY